MAKSDLIIAISALSKKIDGLLDERNKLIARINDLQIENEKLKSLHTQDSADLENALRDIEFLSLSHRLADSPEALVEARKIISSLIRTIDSCIRLIKED